MKIKLKAAYNITQYNLDSHDFEQRKDIKSKTRSDLNYHKCKMCGFIVFEIDDKNSRFDASGDYNSRKLIDKTCGEIIMVAVME